MTEPEVQIYGNTAILTHKETASGSDEGQPSNYTGKLTMIYWNEGGRWRECTTMNRKIRQRTERGEILCPPNRF